MKKNHLIMIDYIKRELENILSLKLNENETLYKKILIMSIIDTLSKTLPENIRKQNRSRVTNLINRFSNWPYKNHISLPHLIKLLELSNDSNLFPLKNYCTDLFNDWEKGGNFIDKDPSYEDVIKMCNIDYLLLNERKIFIKHLTHVHLFY